MAAPAEPLVSPEIHKEDVSDRNIALPESVAPSELEYCLLEDGDGWRQMRLRNDPRLWERPGVYERLVRDLLQGNAPNEICRLLDRDVRAAGESPSALRALILDAGNGWVADELRSIGAGPILGVDRSQEAAAAAERDYPGTFCDYRVIDMRRLSEDQRDHLMNFDFNCLVWVDPLAPDEPSPNAFTEAFNLLAPHGWIAFHLQEESWTGDGESRFGRLLQQMVRMGALDVVTEERYRHRLTTHGTPLFHMGIIARKLRDFDPAEA